MKTKLLKATWFLLQWSEFDFHKPIWFGRNSYLHYEKYKNTGGGEEQVFPMGMMFFILYSQWTCNNFAV